MNEIQNTDRCFFTQQVFLIGTYNEDKTENFAPISWISFTSGEKSCLVISMGGTKQTKKNIERTGLMSATVLTPDLLPFAECCNTYTKNDVLLKSATPEFCKGNVLDVPLIAGAKWSYECRVVHTVALGESHTYFAEFEKVNVHPDILKLDFIDLRAINPVVYSPNNYFTIGEHIGEIGDYSK
ncbi:MAG: flavin reductase [Oscillospiraceae bacterium]|nr:flavin reductase [Oscillospiraceae bacterium]